MHQFATAERLAAWAAELASELNSGDHLGLVGGLGAGKTTFVVGLAQGLGCTIKPTSPTFSLRHCYPVIRHPTISELIHVDLYRLAKHSEISELGLPEDFQTPGTLVVIEWADRTPQLRRFLRYLLEFTIDHSGGRTVRLKDLSRS